MSLTTATVMTIAQMAISRAAESLGADTAEAAAQVQADEMVVAVGAVVVVSHAVVAGVLGALEVLVPLQKTQSKPILWQVPRFVLLRHCCQGLGAPATTVPYQWAATAHPERADGAPRVQAQLSILRESKLPKQL